jgi:hypothetical protein
MFVSTSIACNDVDEAPVNVQRILFSFSSALVSLRFLKFVFGFLTHLYVGFSILFQGENDNKILHTLKLIYCKGSQG